MTLQGKTASYEMPDFLTPKQRRTTERLLTFRRGWFDRLSRMPYPKEYDRLQVPPLDYERGRHAAALYEHDCRLAGRTINIVPYNVARKTMGLALRKMLDEERKWCALRPKKRAVQQEKALFGG